MKNKILTAVSTIMLFIPWTILPLRCFDWALKSPAAEIMILSYAAFMIFSGIFSILVYTKGKVKSKLMQVCVAINSIYAVGDFSIVGMSIVGLFLGCFYENLETFDRCSAFAMLSFGHDGMQRRSYQRRCVEWI